MKKVVVADWKILQDRDPTYALIANVDLVIVKYDEDVSVFYGICLHRGALLADGSIKGDNLVCGVHYWDFRYDTGVSEYDNDERLVKFNAWVEDGKVLVDEIEIGEWEKDNPQPYQRDNYLGLYADTEGTSNEPHVAFIQSLARDGLEKMGHHGPASAMGVPREELPLWDDSQIVTAQVSKFPHLDEVEVGTETIIGPSAKKPLKLKIPLFVSDMSFGALSEEAKLSLVKGAELAGTGICSGEGGMLPEEQEVNSRYFYELASGRFGFSMDKVKGKIAEVRGLKEGEPAISPARFPGWNDERQIKEFADQVKEETGGIPIGYKLSAQHIEADIEAALLIGVNYIILDGRGGGTGAAPLIFRDHISVPTIPALTRARRYLDKVERKDIPLIITGGLRVPADFVKAMALGADAIVVSNSAIQAIGCLGMRACHTNNCPVGIATQKEHLRKRLIIDESAARLEKFFGASVELMKVLSRACSHSHFNEFELSDLTTWKKEMSDLAGIPFAGVGSV